MFPGPKAQRGGHGDRKKFALDVDVWLRKFHGDQGDPQGFWLPVFRMVSRIFRPKTSFLVNDFHEGRILRVTIP
jgi:hypothetical protein